MAIKDWKYEVPIVYDDIYDLVENCKIEGKKFKDLLLSHEIVVTWKDKCWL